MSETAPTRWIVNRPIIGPALTGFWATRPMTRLRYATIIMNRKRGAR